MNKKNNTNVMNDARTIGDKQYDVRDYQSNTFVSKGLAATHEQVSDTYTEGTLEAVIESSESEGK
ncbi:YozQ family protein [Aneurinibacillus uraniidurans]|uniref:YozQ family protein n=1 Tax=Aneurinibacillus uraniidurans TaxID=2966586 RepID=UPI00234A6357|nr:YozQ family protein [Aneurinibacillus sp. B1]WCN39547.1 YozQ family protein [Aneurinibacillus sp. B1]